MHSGEGLLNALDNSEPQGKSSHNLGNQFNWTLHSDRFRSITNICAPLCSLSFRDFLAALCGQRPQRLSRRVFLPQEFRKQSKAKQRFLRNGLLVSSCAGLTNSAAQEYFKQRLDLQKRFQLFPQYLGIYTYIPPSASSMRHDVGEGPSPPGASAGAAAGARPRRPEPSAWPAADSRESLEDTTTTGQGREQHSVLIHFCFGIFCAQYQSLADSRSNTSPF